jgi:hypothetical protein
MIWHLFQSELANFASTTRNIHEKTNIDKRLWGTNRKLVMQNMKFTQENTNARRGKHMCKLSEVYIASSIFFTCEDVIVQTKLEA